MLPLYITLTCIYCVLLEDDQVHQNM